MVGPTLTCQLRANYRKRTLGLKYRPSVRADLKKSVFSVTIRQDTTVPFTSPHPFGLFDRRQEGGVAGPRALTMDLRITTTYLGLPGIK